MAVTKRVLSQSTNWMLEEIYIVSFPVCIILSWCTSIISFWLLSTPMGNKLVLQSIRTGLLPLYVGVVCQDLLYPGDNLTRFITRNKLPKSFQRYNSSVITYSVTTACTASITVFPWRAIYSVIHVLWEMGSKVNWKKGSQGLM